MTKYTALSPDHEILGAAIITYRDLINQENYREFYTHHGLDQVQPDQWYPYQKVLDVMTAISEQGGGQLDFVSIGMAVSAYSPMPPEMAQLPFSEIMMQLSSVPYRFNRGSDIGYTHCTQVSPTHLKFEVRDAAPDDLLYGAFYGWAKRYLPQGSSFVVRYDTDSPRRELGGNDTILHVSWEDEAKQDAKPAHKK